MRSHEYSVIHILKPINQSIFHYAKSQHSYIYRFIKMKTECRKTTLKQHFYNGTGAHYLKICICKIIWKYSTSYQASTACLKLRVRSRVQLNKTQPQVYADEIIYPALSRENISLVNENYCNVKLLMLFRPNQVMWHSAAVNYSTWFQKSTPSPI